MILLTEPLSPAVAESAVIGWPDEKWGELPLALTVLKPEHAVTEKDIIHLVRDYVGRGLLPKEAILLRVKFVETIDKTSVGKINKVALREKYAKK